MSSNSCTCIVCHKMYNLVNEGQEGRKEWCLTWSKSMDNFLPLWALYQFLWSVCYETQCDPALPSVQSASFFLKKMVAWPCLHVLLDVLLPPTWFFFKYLNVLMKKQNYIYEPISYFVVSTLISTYLISLSFLFICDSAETYITS